MTLVDRVIMVLGRDKAIAWFSSPNPLLGDVSPQWMLDNGRYEQLRKFIGESA